MYYSLLSFVLSLECRTIIVFGRYIGILRHVKSIELCHWFAELPGGCNVSQLSLAVVFIIRIRNCGNVYVTTSFIPIVDGVYITS